MADGALRYQAVSELTEGRRAHGEADDDLTAGVLEGLLHREVLLHGDGDGLFEEEGDIVLGRLDGLLRVLIVEAADHEAIQLGLLDHLRHVGVEGHLLLLLGAQLVLAHLGLIRVHDPHQLHLRVHVLETRAVAVGAQSKTDDT